MAANKPTTEEIVASMARTAEEFSKALADGRLDDARAMVCSVPSFGAPLPSPQLVAINKHLQARRAAVKFNLDNPAIIPMIRAVYSTALLPLTGPAIAPYFEATEFEALHGVKGYWCEWPGVSRDRGVVYLHGGGMIMGDARYTHGFLGRLSRALDARVLSVEYGLRPETPIDKVAADAYAGVRHFITDLGLDSGSVAIVGESGGGQLTSIVVQNMAAGDAIPRAGVAWIISPAASANKEDEERLRGAQNARDSDVWIPPRTMDHFSRFTLGEVEGAGDTVPGTDPRISPLYGSFAGAAPIFFTVSDTEGLRDDGVALHKMAMEAGVRTELSMSAHGPHAFPLFDCPEALEEIARFGRFWSTVTRA